MHVVSTKPFGWSLAVAGLVVAALVTVGGAPARGATPCQRTFTNATSQPISAFTFGPPLPPLFIPMPIPGSGTSTVDVGEGTIADIDVTVHITHASAESLSLTVQHGLTPALLKNVGGTTGSDFAGTTFDDEATLDIAGGAPPYSGGFRPASPLSVYDGSAAGGTWTLSVSNPSSVLPGTIDSWSVTVTYAGTCDLDSDAVEDHSDQCLNLAGAASSGCPLASRSVTAKYRHGAFKGVLASSAAACRSARSVTVWKVRPGADRKLGTRSTASDGSYRLRRARHPGTYYATSPRVVVSGVAECPATTSPRFRLR